MAILIIVGFLLMIIIVPPVIFKNLFSLLAFYNFKNAAIRWNGEQYFDNLSYVDTLHKIIDTTATPFGFDLKISKVSTPAILIPLGQYQAYKLAHAIKKQAKKERHGLNVLNLSYTIDDMMTGGYPDRKRVQMTDVRWSLLLDVFNAIKKETEKEKQSSIQEGSETPSALERFNDLTEALASRNEGVLKDKNRTVNVLVLDEYLNHLNDSSKQDSEKNTFLNMPLEWQAELSIAAALDKYKNLKQSYVEEAMDGTEPLKPVSSRVQEGFVDFTTENELYKMWAKEHSRSRKQQAADKGKH